MRLTAQDRLCFNGFVICVRADVVKLATPTLKDDPIDVLYYTLQVIADFRLDGTSPAHVVWSRSKDR